RAFDDPEARARDIAKNLADRLWTFALLGLAYVVLRLVLFGNATQAYAGAPVEVFSGAHWKELLASWWVWTAAVFPGAGALRGTALAASAILLALGIFAGAARHVTAALLALLGTLAA